MATPASYSFFLIHINLLFRFLSSYHPIFGEGESALSPQVSAEYFKPFMTSVTSAWVIDGHVITFKSVRHERILEGGSQGFGKASLVMKKRFCDTGLIPGLERSAGEGNANPLQYSCLGNPMD